LAVSDKQTITGRAWQRMLSGRRLDLLNPSPLDIEIEDIAHGLARVARWNGQTIGNHALSVAQHCLLVERIAGSIEPDLDRDWRLAALLHDGPEYVMGDLISPFKSAIGLDYKTLEVRLLEAIHIRFGLPPNLPEDVASAIKRSDKIAAYLEATRLAGFAEREARKFFTAPRKNQSHLLEEFGALEADPAPRAQAQYLERYAELTT